MSHSILYGIHPIQRALTQNPHSLDELIVLAEGQNPRVLALIALATQAKIPIKMLTKPKLTAYCGTTHHQGIAARLQFANHTLDEDDLLSLVETKQCSLLLILDGIQDPHNLGAILRTADAAGVKAIVVPQDRCVKITPAVSKVACGAAETVPVISVKNLARFLQNLQSLGMWLIGTQAEQAKLLYEVDLTGRIALVLGAEGTGLRHLTAKQCDYLVSIPLYGQVASLNVSVATGICLYEVIRQRLST